MLQAGCSHGGLASRRKHAARMGAHRVPLAMTQRYSKPMTYTTCKPVVVGGLWGAEGTGPDTEQSAGHSQAGVGGSAWCGVGTHVPGPWRGRGLPAKHLSEVHATPFRVEARAWVPTFWRSGRLCHRALPKWEQGDGWRAGSSSRISRRTLHAGSRGGGCRDMKSSHAGRHGTQKKAPPSKPPGGASGLAALVKRPQSPQIGAVINCQPNLRLVHPSDNLCSTVHGRIVQTPLSSRARGSVAASVSQGRCWCSWRRYPAAGRGGDGDRIVPETPPALPGSYRSARRSS